MVFGRFRNCGCCAVTLMNVFCVYCGTGFRSFRQTHRACHAGPQEPVRGYETASMIPIVHPFYCVCHLSVFRRSVSWLDVRIALLRVIDVQRVFMRRSGVDFNAGRLARSKILPFRCGSPAMCCVLAGRFRRNVSKMRTFLRQNQNTSYPSREVDNSAFVSDASRDVCRNRLGNDACMSLQNTVEWCGGVCIGSLLSESHLRDYQTCDTLGRCFSTFLMSRPTFAPISKSHKKWSYWSVESAPTRPYVCNTWSPHLPWVCGTHNCNPGLKMGAFLGWNATILHFWLS